MNMITSKLIFTVLIIALAAAFVVLLVKKWGIDEWMQIHGDTITSKLFSCDFCMSFWTCVILTMVVMMFYEDSYLLAVPFLSTPLTRWLL